MKDQLEQILPRGIGVGSGFVIDSYGGTSRQTDIVLYEKDICPVFSINGTPETTYYPCECVIAVGEVKSRLDGSSLKDAFKKVASVKRVQRHQVLHPVPFPTGQRFPIYRSYGDFQGDSIHNFDELPGDRARIFGFVFGGNMMIKLDTLMSLFVTQTQKVGSGLSPNLLVSLDGATFYWGKLTSQRSEVATGDDGKYSLQVRSDGPLTVNAEWSEATATHLISSRSDDPFRVLIQWIRNVFRSGRTSDARSLDRYFDTRNQTEMGMAEAIRTK